MFLSLGSWENPLPIQNFKLTLSVAGPLPPRADKLVCPWPGPPTHRFPAPPWPGPPSHQSAANPLLFCGPKTLDPASTSAARLLSQADTARQSFPRRKWATATGSTSSRATTSPPTTLRGATASGPRMTMRWEGGFFFYNFTPMFLRRSIFDQVLGVL